MDRARLQPRYRVDNPHNGSNLTNCGMQTYLLTILATTDSFLQPLHGSRSFQTFFGCNLFNSHLSRHGRHVLLR